MVGKELDGDIEKIDVEPYEYTLDSGETIEIAHRRVFIPSSAKVVSLDSKAA